MDGSDIEDSIDSISPQYSPSYQQSFDSESSSSRYSTPSFPTSALPTTGTFNSLAPSTRATTSFIPPYHRRDRTPLNSHYDHGALNPFDEWQDYSEVRAPELPQGSAGRSHQSWVPPQSPPYTPFMPTRHNHQGRPVMHEMPAPSENVYFKKKYLDLLAAYHALESEMKGFRCAHDALVRSITSASTSTQGGYPGQPYHSGPSYKIPAQSSLLLDPADYPNVQYWQAGSFKASTQDAVVLGEVTGKGGSGQRANGENVAYLFIEDKNGIPATADLVNRITAHARRVFSELLKSNAAPQKWSQGTLRAQNYFRAEMYQNFPDLQLCENNWKADKIATHLYSGWFRTCKSDTDEAIKVEPSVVDNHDIVGDLNNISDSLRHQPAQSSTQKPSAKPPTKPSARPSAKPSTKPSATPSTKSSTKPSAKLTSLKHYLPVSSSDTHEGSRKKPYNVPGTLQPSIHLPPGGVFPSPVFGGATELFAGSLAGTTTLIDTDGDLEMLLPGIKILGSETPAISIIHAPAPVASPPTQHPAPTILPTPTPAINMEKDSVMEDSPQLESRSPALATESNPGPDYDEPSQFSSMDTHPSDIGFGQLENSQSTFADQGISQTGDSPLQVVSPMVTFASAHLPVTVSTPARSPEITAASTPVRSPAIATNSTPVCSPETTTASIPAPSPTTAPIIPKLIHPLLGFGNFGQNPIQTTSRLTAKATEAITRTLGGTESQVATLTNSHLSSGLASTSSAGATVTKASKKDTKTYYPSLASISPRGLFNIDYRNKNGIAPVSVYRAAWSALDKATTACYTERSNLLKKRAKEAKEKAAAGDGSALP